MGKKKKQQVYVVFLNMASCVFVVLSIFHQQDLDKSLLLKSQGGSCKALEGKSKDVSQGYIDYIYLFYCKFGGFPFLGYALLCVWLLVLFYLLGNTASDYFCSSLESLSKLFNLSPTIAGVTLLSLGNGAPDVFSTLVSFVGGDGGGSIGLNTLLGGASVVTCVVVGMMSITMRKRCVRVNKSDFVRDALFFLLVLLCLAAILVQQEIDLWGAISFFSIYAVYVIVVYVLHMRSKDQYSTLDSTLGTDLTAPILPTIEKHEESSNSVLRVLISILELPLYLPRRLTIPVAYPEDKWSKMYGVASVTLGPVLLAALGSHQVDGSNERVRLGIYGIGLVSGLSLGVGAYMTTERSRPPEKKMMLGWTAAGFLMSVTWSYMIAQELVGLLVSLAYVLGVDASILGLTVLAWGNSIGDLVTNMTMALKGGSQGAQIAFSGCYAGPIFNTLFGLGLSLVGYCWAQYPSPVPIPRDPYVWHTMAFLAAALLWALLVLPLRDMRLDAFFGAGLLLIYIASLSFSLFHSAQLS